MAILPAVYVTIEDKSFALPTIETGRVGFIVILADRGIHNKVVQVNSPQELHLRYGKPNIEKTGQAHYLAEKFLQYSSRLFVIRPVILDDTDETNNAAISNVFIKYNKIQGSSQLFSSSAFKFLFVNSPDINIATQVIVNAVAYENFDIGDLIYREPDDQSVAVKIVDKYIDTLSNDYILKIENIYDGTYNDVGVYNTNQNSSYKVTFTNDSTEVVCADLKTYNEFNAYDKVGIVSSNTFKIISKVRESGAGGVVYKLILDVPFNDPAATGNLTSNFTIVSFWDNSVYKFYPGPQDIPLLKYTFTNSSNLVEAKSLASYQALSVKDWIYPAGGESNSDPSFMRQVIQKFVDDNGKYQIALDDVFIGDDTLNDNGQLIKRYRAFEADSSVNVRSESQISSTDADNIWHFYGLGAGKYYNNIYLTGVRNTVYENLYTDASGNPIYKYAFMDLYVYENDENTGNSTLVEGPWLVSLIRTTSSGQVIRDINTGLELYIENIINMNSQYIRCKAALGAEELLVNEDAELLRLNVLSMFSQEQVFRTQTLGDSGVSLNKGEDGCQFDSRGKLNLMHPKVQGIVAKCYAATLESEDQTIENLTNVIFPWFKFDYIICGGYSAEIQNNARELADRRNDCMVLADTGYNVKADDDIRARRVEFPWNTWNAMLYTGYRQIFDTNTGKYIYITPVYHAVERHLYCDAKYWIAEPVAGVEKGAISEPIKLVYNANLTKLEDMTSMELNPTIVEPDGVYILNQFTTWKRLSIMKRGHAVKFVHYVRKEIPSLLKDILQRKMTPYWINLAKERVNGFMTPFVSSGGSERYAAISSFSVNVLADEARNELRVILTLKPLRVIEAIHVNIIVQ